MDPATLLILLFLIVAAGLAYFLLGAGGMARSGKGDPESETPSGSDGESRPEHTVVRDESDSGRAHGA
jgi:hypothetical protein